MVLVYCVFLVMWCAIAARCNYEAQALSYGIDGPAIARGLPEMQVPACSCAPFSATLVMSVEASGTK